MTAVLGQAAVRMQDFLQFEPGDVIVLEQQINQPLELWVEGQPLFEVQAGTLQGRRAVQCLRVKGEEPDE